jgi:peptidoglycan hydrolase CwlO-like protein
MNKKLVQILAGVMAAVMLLALMLSLLISTVHAASSSEIQDQIDNLEQEYEEQQKALDELEKILAENNREIQNMVDRKNGIDQQIVILNNQIVTLSQIVSAHNLQIADKQDELDASQEKLALLQEAYQDRIRAMEEQGEVSYWSVIFKANSFADLLDRLNMIVEIAQSDRIRMQQIRDLAQQIEDAKQELDAQKAEMEADKLELQLTQRELEAKGAEADGLLFALLEAGGEYQLLLARGEGGKAAIKIEADAAFLAALRDAIAEARTAPEDEE